MARAVLATTRKMLQGAIKRDAWLEIMVAWAETPVANHELLLSCFDFIAKMMAGGVSISRVVVGASRVVAGMNRAVAGANRAVVGANRVMAEASSVVAERNSPDAVVSTDFGGGSLRGRIADYGPRECDFYENILPRLRLLLTLHSEYKAYSKGCLGSCPG